MPDPYATPLAVPDDATLLALLATTAPLQPTPLCPELLTFHARSLVEVWDAAERAAHGTLPSPFWAYPWAGGQALARVILDSPDRVRGRRVLDFGTGGGVVALACAFAGASEVVANDIDPWALAVTRLAAAAQGLRVTTLERDLTAMPTAVGTWDVVLCGDLGYDRSSAPTERAVLEAARQNGARLLVADAGRTYFDGNGFRAIAAFDVAVPEDLEGKALRRATVYEG